MTTEFEKDLQARNVSEARKESIRLAIEAGCADDTLIAIRDAAVLSRAASIILRASPMDRLTRGWRRSGENDDDTTRCTWVAGRGYQVRQGTWVVGDGPRSREWTVRHIAVGSATWTLAD